MLDPTLQPACHPNSDDPFPQWTCEFVEAARHDGWGLDDNYQIVKNDDAVDEHCLHAFDTDEAALNHVRNKALRGSPMHCVALEIHVGNRPANLVHHVRYEQQA